MQHPGRLIIVACSSLLLYNSLRRNGYFGETPFVIYTNDANVCVARTLFWDTVYLRRWDVDETTDIRERSWKPIRLEYVNESHQ